MSSRLLKFVIEELAHVSVDCNTIELHIVRDFTSQELQTMKPANEHGISNAHEDGSTTTLTRTQRQNHTHSNGSACVDLSREIVISSMRTALASRELKSCTTRLYRFQSSHNADMTLVALHQPHVVHYKDVRETLVQSRLSSVKDMRTGSAIHLPLVWLNWENTHLSPSHFPCTVEQSDVRHCVRREIIISHDTSLFFETNMNESGKCVYRQWIEVTNHHNFEVAKDVVRALTGLGISG